MRKISKLTKPSVAKAGHSVSLLIAALLIASCARLKQFAYEGFDRDNWQHPEKVIAALRLQPGDTVADLGSGGGYFTFRLAKAVTPTGKIYAVDTDPDMIDLIGERAKKETPSQVEPILAKPDDPMLPATGVDMVFSCNTYHHIDNRVTYFANLHKYLHSGGKVAIIDLNGHAWPEGWLGHYTSSESIKKEMDQAGYILQQELDFLDRQSFLIFTAKP